MFFSNDEAILTEIIQFFHMEDDRLINSKNDLGHKKQQKEVASTETKLVEKNNEESEQKDESGLQPGKIFEESTKSISDMANDVSETARIVSSMKEGLVRVNKIADVIYGDPLGKAIEDKATDPSCCQPDQQFDMEPNENRAIMNNKIDDLVTKYTKNGLEDLKLDTETIRRELQQFQNNIRQKESELIEFREKLSQVRQQAKKGVNQNPGEIISSNGLLEKVPQNPQSDLESLTEFDAITSSDQDLSDFNAMQQESRFDNLDNQQEIHEGEKKLLELRWKIKKEEAEYEKRRAEKEEFEDLTSQIQTLESKRDQLKNEVKKLENQNKEPKQELKELEQKIEQAKKEYEEKLEAKQQVEDVRSVLEYLKLDKDSIKSDLEEMRVKLKNVEKEYQEKKAAKDELEDVRFNVTALKAEKETILAELEQMHTRVKKAESELEEKRAEKEKLGEFKAVFTHMKIEKESLGAEIDELKAKIKKAESEYQEKKAAVEELHEVREILAYLKPERDAVKSELNQLRDKIERLQDSYDEINSRKRELQLEYDDLKSRLRKLESEYEEKKNSFQFR